MNLLFTSLVAIFCTIALQAQTIHDIEAGGGGTGNPDPYYAPQFLTIQQGDIVRWTNSGGTHNVDGTMETFPDNPESFTNGPANNNLWVFEHTFDLPGFYEFECAAFDHNETQFGSITVAPNGLEEYSDLSVTIYPNPSSDFLNVYLEEKVLEASVLTLDMKEVISIEVNNLEKELHVDLTALNEGLYFLIVKTDSGKAIRRFIRD